MNKFKIKSTFKPAGDQPKAIDELVKNFKANKKHQTLLGATGTGKTFTMAHVIEHLQKPTLVLCHNKLLAAQLASEFREFFPDNAVNYFISYFDYYQPEAYIPATDTYIEKDSITNKEIEKFRNKTTTDLLTRLDVIVVASVSCIYGLGNPKYYFEKTISLRKNDRISKMELLEKLTEIRYIRDDIKFEQNKIRVRGDIIDIYPSFADIAYRIEFFDKNIDNIYEIDPINNKVLSMIDEVKITPATHFLVDPYLFDDIEKEIRNDLELRVAELKAQGKDLYAHRLKQRTNFDLEMIRETGFCNGIENYSPYFDGRKPGEPPLTLLDYFPKDFLMIIDESHMTIPQIGGMYEGDRSRKLTLIEYGFRLPRAIDHRPLKFEEFEQKINQVLYVSATPKEYEIKKSNGYVEQIIRPTGLLDPEIVVKDEEGQMDDLLNEINIVIKRNERVLITTITKKFAEDITLYLQNVGIKAKYMHSDIDALDRISIIRDLRLGKINVIVGVNLLREGLDLPEVSLIAILDADKVGFLRSKDALIQTIGRAARNANGKVIMYSYKGRITEAMKLAIDETYRRRKIQMEYNKKHGIVPKTIIKEIKDIQMEKDLLKEELYLEYLDKDRDEILKYIKILEKKMNDCVKERKFEEAIEYRDKINLLKEEFDIK